MSSGSRSVQESELQTAVVGPHHIQSLLKTLRRKKLLDDQGLSWDLC
jgi:hypothetical protein